MVISPPSLPTPMTQRLQFKSVSSPRRTPLLTDLNHRPPPEPPDPPDRVPLSQCKSSTIYLGSPSIVVLPLLTHLELVFRVPEIYLLQSNRSTHSEKEQPPSPPFVELQTRDLRLSLIYRRMLLPIVDFPHRSVCLKRAFPRTVRAQDSAYQLERYMSNSTTRAFFVSLQNVCVDMDVLLWTLAVLRPPSLKYTALQSLEDWTFDVDTLVREWFVATVLLTHYSPYVFWVASPTSNRSGVSLSNHTILKPDSSTCDSTALPCSSEDKSFTEAARQFTVRCASVYRVHLPQICDFVHDFTSVSPQLPHACSVYTSAAPLLMIIKVKSRQFRSYCMAIAMRSALCKAVILEFLKLKVFSNNSTLFRAISSNFQSKEIIGIVKGIRSISSGFASIYISQLSRSENVLAYVLAKKALQAFLFV